MVSAVLISCSNDDEEDCPCQSIFAPDWDRSFLLDCEALDAFSSSIENGVFIGSPSLNTLEITESKSDCD